MPPHRQPYSTPGDTAYLEHGRRDLVVDGLHVVLGVAEVVGEERAEVPASLGDPAFVDLEAAIAQDERQPRVLGRHPLERLCPLAVGPAHLMAHRPGYA